MTLVSAVAAAASIGKPAPTIGRNRVVATVLSGHIPAPGPAGTSRLSLGTLEAIVKSRSIDLARPADAAIPPRRTGGCLLTAESTVLSDQTCTSRRMVSGQLAVDPTRPWHLLAGQNDARDGYSHCYYYSSRDGGVVWGDGFPAFLQRANQGTFNDPLVAPAQPSGHNYDTASDPVIAFDSGGQGYLACAVFDINSPASSIMVTAAVEKTVPGGPAVKSAEPHVVTEDNNSAIFNDSPTLAADWHTGSPFRDHLYLAWSRLSCDASGACLSNIYLSRSTDRGQSWSAPTLISGGGTVCGGDCSLSQGAAIVTRQDGLVSVAFNNANSGRPLLNQQLLVQSRDGGRSWSQPVKIGDDFLASHLDGALHPTCDLGLGPEECVSTPSFVRLRDVPRIAVDSSGATFAVVWQDYRNGRCLSDYVERCAISGGISDENYDVIEATSTDGGANWTSRAIFPERPPGAAQFDPSAAINGATGAMAISYYDRGLNDDITNSRMDYTLSLARSASDPLSRILVSRLPDSLPEDASQKLIGFARAYAGPVWSRSTVLVLWSDGRRLDRNDVPSPTGKLSGPSVIAVPT